MGSKHSRVHSPDCWYYMDYTLDWTLNSLKWFIGVLSLLDKGSFRLNRVNDSKWYRWTEPLTGISWPIGRHFVVGVHEKSFCNVFLRFLLNLHQLKSQVSRQAFCDWWAQMSVDRSFWSDVRSAVLRTVLRLTDLNVDNEELLKALTGLKIFKVTVLLHGSAVWMRGVPQP